MNWHDLLFMHWPIPVDAIRRFVPRSLEIDRFEGSAWIGVVPFSMTGVRPRFLPALLASDFPEVNVRTYVRHKEKPGVWFFSLDAADRLAVWTARRFFNLPYHYASMSVIPSGDEIEYHSRRVGSSDVQLSCRYRPVGTQTQSVAGTLEYFLTERYCLYATDNRGNVFRGDIHHTSWPLQAAEAEVQINTMMAPLGLDIGFGAPVLHFAKRLDVLAWSLTQAV